MHRKRIARRGIAVLIALCLLIAHAETTAAASAAGLTQVAGGHWAERQLDDWLQKGLLQGYGDESLKPDQPVTRAEFIALTNRAFGFVEASDAPFADLAASHWAYEEIRRAVKAGYIRGNPDNTVGADRAVTRAEAAVVASRLLAWPERDGDAAGEYADREVWPSWARGAINAAVAEGVMRGYADKRFRPYWPITRAEAVVVLSRALNLKESVQEETGVVDPGAELSGGAGAGDSDSGGAGHAGEGGGGTGNTGEGSGGAGPSKSPEQLADEALSALSIAYSPGDSASSVTGPLGLPTAGAAGTTVSWTSSHPAVVAADGSVIRPSPSSGNQAVELIASVTSGSVTKTRTFAVTVLALPDTTAPQWAVTPYLAETGADTIGIGFETDEDAVVHYLALDASEAEPDAERITGDGAAASLPALAGQAQLARISDLLTNKEYRVSLIAVDQAGNRSEVRHVVGRTRALPEKTAVDDTSITIRWIPEPGADTKIYIQESASASERIADYTETAVGGYVEAVVTGEAGVPLQFGVKYALRIETEKDGVVVQSTTLTAAPGFWDGSGTADDPYLLTTAAHLNNVRSKLDSSFKLAGDIDLDVFPYNAGEGWMPIGAFDLFGDTAATSFTGTFDGAGFAVSNLYMNRTKSISALFAQIQGSAELKNVRLENVDITGDTYVGALVAIQRQGTIRGVHATGAVRAARADDTNSAGGLVGSQWAGLIADSSFAGEVVGSGYYVGGLVGYRDGGTISGSYSTAETSGAAAVGGLVGYGEGGTLIDSYATGSVHGAMYSGGLVGYNDGQTVSTSYAVGEADALPDNGGLIGYYVAGTIVSSYYNNGNAQPQPAGAFGHAPAELRLSDTFAGWLFGPGGAWSIDPANPSHPYPYLNNNPPRE
ncbi:S-layer homology domain-containing protein [Cohnella cellulosilytica]|uniref:S-layer homology domain-containing protein n=1 Tax=Cohnella cellulosilytica TaxID=986710 RepID=A0ABW2FBA0_9BACL